MEPWVHQQIKNASVMNLHTISHDDEIFSVPCLIHYEKGILFLHPLRNYDHCYNNIENNDKGSISIEVSLGEQISSILLKGKLQILHSSEKWTTLKLYWTSVYSFLGPYFDLQERYVLPSMNQRLLSFKPDQIWAWENIDSKPIKYELEII
ncbi:MAG: hypothetical protein HeimC2_41180 [Candidatus Heimdallarchaeota archaeon LC_2]|nr:MAG: hypothetical protein HeimC2_41180 [Candidatus Heimdallarchaeota archaeon LC_2]